MCGRFSLSTPPDRVARFFEASQDTGVAEKFRPSWNVAPTTKVLGVRRSGEGRLLSRYRWGLVPPWAKDLSGASRLCNARGETVAAKPSFRHAFAKRRLVMPADGFFEWHRTGSGRTPHYFHRADGDPLAFAALYELWRDPSAGHDGDLVPAPDATGLADDGGDGAGAAGSGAAGSGAGARSIAGSDAAPWIWTCTIITTAAGDDIDGIHDRMPVILDPETLDAWLDPASDRQTLQGLLLPAPAGTLVHHVVDQRVGSVRNNDAGLVEPLVEPGSLQPSG